jgi:hypothetical protein
VSRPRLAVVTSLLAELAAGCPEDDEPSLPACLEIDTSCAPLYEPTFDNVFAMTLQPSCGVAGGSCHGAPDADGAAGGLVMSEADATYDLLVDASREPRAFVEPGDASCSLLAIRVSIDDDDLRMPPGSSLDPRVRCSIVQWIDEGAVR